MGAWGEGNFENDAALDYLGDLIDELVDEVEELFDSDEAYTHRGGEGMLIPIIEVMNTLCTHLDATPPEPARVQQWARQYLAYFDREGHSGWLDPNELRRRRNNIKGAFDQLTSHAKSYYEESEQTDVRH